MHALEAQTELLWPDFLKYSTCLFMVCRYISYKLPMKLAIAHIMYSVLMFKELYCNLVPIVDHIAQINLSLVDSNWKHISVIHIATDHPFIAIMNLHMRLLQDTDMNKGLQPNSTYLFVMYVYPFNNNDNISSNRLPGTCN